MLETYDADDRRFFILHGNALFIGPDEAALMGRKPMTFRTIHSHADKVQSRLAKLPHALVVGAITTTSNGLKDERATGRYMLSWRPWRLRAIGRTARRLRSLPFAAARWVLDAVERIALK